MDAREGKKQAERQKIEEGELQVGKRRDPCHRLGMNRMKRKDYCCGEAYRTILKQALHRFENENHNCCVERNIQGVKGEGVGTEDEVADEIRQAQEGPVIVRDSLERPPQGP